MFMKHQDSVSGRSFRERTPRSECQMVSPIQKRRGMKFEKLASAEIREDFELIGKS